MKVDSIHDVEEAEGLDSLHASASIVGAFRSLAMAWAKLRIAAGMPSSATTFCEIVEEDIVVVSMILRDMFYSSDVKRHLLTVDRLWSWASKLSQDSVSSSLADDGTIGDLTGHQGSGPISPSYIVALTPTGIEIMVGFNSTIVHSSVVHSIARRAAGDSWRTGKDGIEEDSTVVKSMYVESYKNSTFGEDDE